MVSKAQENSHGARFEFDGRSVPRNLVKRGIDAPGADSKYPVVRDHHRLRDLHKLLNNIAFADRASGLQRAFDASSIRIQRLLRTRQVRSAQRRFVDLNSRP
jgi:ABC-type taurine transport system ATPase subunit